MTNEGTILGPRNLILKSKRSVFAKGKGNRRRKKKGNLKTSVRSAKKSAEARRVREWGGSHEKKGGGTKEGGLEEKHVIHGKERNTSSSDHTLLWGKTGKPGRE